MNGPVLVVNFGLLSIDVYGMEGRRRCFRRKIQLKTNEDLSQNHNQLPATSRRHTTTTTHDLLTSRILRRRPHDKARPADMSYGWVCVCVRARDQRKSSQQERKESNVRACSTYRAPSWSGGTRASPWARRRGSPAAGAGTWPPGSAPPSAPRRPRGSGTTCRRGPATAAPAPGAAAATTPTPARARRTTRARAPPRRAAPAASTGAAAPARRRRSRPAVLPRRWTPW
jgi:hypothetical protein